MVVYSKRLKEDRYAVFQKHSVHILSFEIAQEICKYVQWTQLVELCPH